jgi:hypothetical protein
MALGVVWYGMAFHPISFFMFGLCVAPFNDLKNLDFIRSVDKNLADELSEWPMDAQVPFAAAPSISLQSLLANHLQMTVCVPVVSKFLPKQFFLVYRSSTM